MPRETISVESLEEMIRTGEIDTVLCAFPDHLGRLVGKRVVGHYFLEHALAHPLHACAYLLTVDIEMEPLPGFELTSWEKGYGDFEMVLDLRTLRIADWLENTAIVLCDLREEGGGAPIAESPRAILKEQIEKAADKGYRLFMASELEFYLFDETYREIHAKNHQDLKPSSDYIIDYHILGTTYDEGVIRSIRNHLVESGIPVEFSKGEWGNGQHEINIEYADALETADRHALYKNAAKEIAAARGKAISYMAKYSAEAAGNSCHIHASMTGLDDEKNLFWDDKASGPSETFRHFLGGVLKAERELCLLFAPTINSYKRFESGSFAPTAIAWSDDNRTTCLRTVGHGKSFRFENRLPGADANPYVAFAAMMGAGLWGIENKIDCGEPFVGDAYHSDSLEHVPTTMREAVDAFAGSEMAKEIFGERVHRYFVHSSELEIKAFNAAVTDWERRRYFERI